ncbi:MAG: MGMT family protein [Bacteroidota bacterium]|nr:MGMT family protein [Bacteroidota bacterium]
MTPSSNPHRTKTTNNDNFFAQVYDVVRLIPYGRVTSYGAIAKCLGSPQSSRMVGWALNSCHNFSDVPAHRVLNRNGLLTGKVHFGGANVMQQLLESEGITIEDDRVVDFEKLFWDPAEELLNG